MPVYRILSLDGGGVHGLSTIILLRRIAKEHPGFLDKIDLIAGTSIGGILGLGLACGHPTEMIEENFYTGVPLAFHRTRVSRWFFPFGLRPKYDNSGFVKFLTHLFGKSKLKDLGKKVLITSFLLDNEDDLNRHWKAKLFHNFDGSDSDGEQHIRDVAMATSSAIIYFKTHGRYVDGSVIANNPAMCAMAQTQDERIALDPRPKLEDIQILSIGDRRNIYLPGKDMKLGWLSWLSPMIFMFNEGDSDCVNYQCRALIGQRFHRIEPLIEGSMDDIGDVNTIAKVAENYPLAKTLDWLGSNW